MSKPRICIIGVGLIGGSLALALQKIGYVKGIIGTARTEGTLKQAFDFKVIDAYTTDMAESVKEADIVVICTPLGAMRDVFKTIAPALKDDAIITDAGSAKQCVINDAIDTLGKHYKNFVAGHPIAGAERSGVSAANKDLYNQRRVILTPTKETSEIAIKTITAMWQAAGAEVETMSAEHHDMVLAGTSHLPHLLAFGLVDCLNSLEEVDEIFRFAAGGFRDFTRIASSDPVMWRDICLSNRDDILHMMKKYEDELQMITRALQASDGEELINIFSRAKLARDQFNNQ